MNENKLYQSLKIKNKLRNAFIQLSTRELNKSKARGKKMRKNLALILLAVLAVSTIGAAAGFANAEVSTTTNTMMVQQSWVHLTGTIKQWGSTPVNGTISVMARTLTVSDTLARKFIGVSAVWNNGTLRPTGNFTYTFYATKLLNLETAKLNYQGNNFYLNGTWTVYNVTVTNTIIKNDGVTSWHRDVNAVSTTVTGQLNVTDSWTKFTLTLQGIDPLTGSVHRALIKSMQMNICKVSDDGNPKVTIQDLQMVVKAYGAMPGMGNYDQRLDFNMHFKIDLTNLATVAANVGQ